MCVVSMISQHYQEKWGQLGGGNLQNTPGTPTEQFVGGFVSQAEVNEFRALLERARAYDKRNNEPHCENTEKITALKAIAKALNVDISFIDEA